MVEGKANMKKHVDGDSTKGFIYIKDQTANRVRKTIKENDADELELIPEARAWCDRWEGLDIANIIQEASRQ